MGDGAEDKSVGVDVGVVSVGASEEQYLLLVSFDSAYLYSGGEVGRLDLNVLPGF